MRTTRIYVAGPYYSECDILANVHRAIDAGEQLLRRGYAPFVPHLNHWWQQRHPHGVATWYDVDCAWLLAADAVLRLPGDSTGADAEVALAKHVGIQVCEDLEGVLAYMPKVCG